VLLFVKKTSGHPTQEFDLVFRCFPISKNHSISDQSCLY